MDTENPTDNGITNPQPKPETYRAICTKHFGFEVVFEVEADSDGDYSIDAPCPVCVLEAENLRMAKTSVGQIVTVRLSEQDIPTIVDVSVEALVKAAESATQIAMALSENTAILARIADHMCGNDQDRDREPTCPKCHGEMQVRQRKDGSGSFWSCMGYPKCNGTRPFGASGSSSGGSSASGSSSATLTPPPAVVEF